MKAPAPLHTESGESPAVLPLGEAENPRKHGVVRKSNYLIIKRLNYSANYCLPSARLGELFPLIDAAKENTRCLRLGNWDDSSDHVAGAGGCPGSQSCLVRAGPPCGPRHRGLPGHQPNERGAAFVLLERMKGKNVQGEISGWASRWPEPDPPSPVFLCLLRFQSKVPRRGEGLPAAMGPLRRCPCPRVEAAKSWCLFMLL